MANFTVVVQELEASTGAQSRSLSSERPSGGGITLSDFLRMSGGAYQMDFPVDERFRKHLSQIAGVTASAELGEASKAATVPVSVEHLRGSDPESTRISIRFEYGLTAEESVVVERATAAGLID